MGCGDMEDMGLQADLHVFCASVYQQRHAGLRDLLQGVQVSIQTALQSAKSHLPEGVLAQVRAINDELVKHVTTKSRRRTVAEAVRRLAGDRVGKTLGSEMTSAFLEALKTVMLSVQHFHTRKPVANE